MKKQLTVVILLTIILLAFTGCTYSHINNMSLLEEDNNYKIYGYLDKNDILTDYFYIIFNNDGEKIDSGHCERVNPNFQKFDNDVLKLSKSFGSNAKFVTYYDLSKSIVSEEYQNIIYDDGELVIYIYYIDGEIGTHIVTKNIFDSKILLDEELDMGGIMSTDFKVNIEGKIITVEHVKGQNCETIVETFELKQF